MKMQTYRLETIVAEKGVLNIKGLPLHPGERVDVTVKSWRLDDKIQKNRYPLRGKPIKYNAPFDSVAENDWEVFILT